MRLTVDIDLDRLERAMRATGDNTEPLVVACTMLGLIARDLAAGGLSGDRLRMTVDGHEETAFGHYGRADGRSGIEVQEIADDADAVWQHPLVQSVIDEACLNLRIEKDSLPYTALLKIAGAAGTVSRAMTLGFDPDVLRLTPDQAREKLLDQAARLGEFMPVRVVDIDLDA